MTVVQRTPNLGLGIRLTPLAPEPEPAAPAPCPPARVLDPAGEVVAELGCGEEYQYECPPSGGGDCGPCEVTDVVWVGLYQWVETWGGWDFATARLGAEEPGDSKNVIFAGNFAPDATVYGLPIGPAPCGVEWTWSWSGEVLHDGDVRQEGPLLVVDIATSGILNGSQEYENTLTATARCSGAEVGTLTLMVEAFQH